MSSVPGVTEEGHALASAAPAFLKGHGTQNDFIVLLDPDGTFGLNERQAWALCDRRQGLGADGVLRAVPADGGGWFMDYRNADGSVAEMCGNGARVFALALRDAGLVTVDEFVVPTRGGDRSVRFLDGDVIVGMGAATTSARAVTVSAGRGEWAATSVWVPNPHAVAFVDDLADPGSLSNAPDVTPADAFPDGVNVEFVVPRAADRIAMRVHERGVGETRSCGTGAVAAAWAWRRRSDALSEDVPPTIRVDVPGGTVWVTEHSGGELDLKGPAVIVARGVIDEHWWRERA
ncbi:MAG: diaminopimelate epimerase [Actinomycetia bacterium]|nr:diaminopimelate epimerase [Actinomycetes bacterium]